MKTSLSQWKIQSIMKLRLKKEFSLSVLLSAFETLLRRAINESHNSVRMHKSGPETHLDRSPSLRPHTDKSPFFSHHQWLLREDLK